MLLKLSIKIGRGLGKTPLSAKQPIGTTASIDVSSVEEKGNAISIAR